MTAPLAYSYARFSTPEQRLGNSLERQTKAAQEYADAHGLVLDTSLTLRDEGVSAFKGLNFRDGALAEFVAKIDSGEVPPGSFLIVESLDRLSRLDAWSAIGQLQAILGRGISVATLFDQQVYSSATLKDFSTLLKALFVAQTAHEESDKKRKRLLASWKSKRRRASDNGEAMTRMAPGWLKLCEGRYEVINSRAEVVRRIFALALDGVGKGRIAKTFNEEGVPTFGRSTSWHPSTIQKILANEAVIGRYQPHRIHHNEDESTRRVPEGDEILGYFPPIIDEATFLRAMVLRQERRVPRGPSGVRLSNLFTGTATCAHCAAPMHFDNKGDGYTRLICSAAKRGAVSHPPNSWRYRLVERFGLLALHSSLDFSSVIPNSAANDLTVQLRELEEQAMVAREAAAKAGQAVERMLDLLETSDLPDYRTRMELRSKERLEAETNAERLEATANAVRVHIEEEARDRRTTDGTLQEWALVSEGADVQKAFAARVRLQQLLKRSIAHMEVRRGHDGDPTYGDIYVILKNGKSVSMWLSEDDSGEAGMRVHFATARFVHDEEWMPPSANDDPVRYKEMELPEWWPRK